MGCCCSKENGNYELTSPSPTSPPSNSKFGGVPSGFAGLPSVTPSNAPPPAPSMKPTPTPSNAPPSPRPSTSQQTRSTDLEIPLEEMKAIAVAENDEQTLPNQSQMQVMDTPKSTPRGQQAFQKAVNLLASALTDEGFEELFLAIKEGFCDTPRLLCDDCAYQLWGDSRFRTAVRSMDFEYQRQEAVLLISRGQFAWAEEKLKDLLTKRKDVRLIDKHITFGEIHSLLAQCSAAAAAAASGDSAQHQQSVNEGVEHVWAALWYGLDIQRFLKDSAFASLKKEIVAREQARKLLLPPPGLSREQQAEHFCLRSSDLMRDESKDLESALQILERIRLYYWDVSDKDLQRKACLRASVCACRLGQPELASPFIWDLVTEHELQKLQVVGNDPELALYREQREEDWQAVKAWYEEEQFLSDALNLFKAGDLESALAKFLEYDGPRKTSRHAPRGTFLIACTYGRLSDSTRAKISDPVKAMSFLDAARELGFTDMDQVHAERSFGVYHFVESEEFERVMKRMDLENHFCVAEELYRRGCFEDCERLQVNIMHECEPFQEHLSFSSLRAMSLFRQAVCHTKLGREAVAITCLRSFSEKDCQEEAKTFFLLEGKFVQDLTDSLVKDAFYKLLGRPKSFRSQ